MGFTFRAGAATATFFFSAHAAAQGIYICVDASGRRLTSDRPILACLDREQRVLNSSGTLRATLAPSYTAAERAEIEKQQRAQAQERDREAEQRQRLRAMLVRYPNQEALDRERSAAMAPLDDVIGTATERSVELIAERRKLESQAASYAKKPARMPATLQRSIETNDLQLKAQERFIADQKEEQLRLRQRFDEMQRELNLLWAR